MISVETSHQLDYNSQMENFCPFVYGLVDPIDPRHVRYVGMAPRNADRPYHHARLARRISKSSYLLNWIRSIQADGREPAVLILEELSEGTSRRFLGFIEQCYIKSLREIGHRLTNGTAGGEGVVDPTPETRANMSKAALGNTRAVGAVRSLEFRAKVRASLMGHEVTEETRRNQSLARLGKTSSEEAKANQSKGLKAMWARKRAEGYSASPEARANNSAAQKAVWARKKAKCRS